MEALQASIPARSRRWRTCAARRRCLPGVEFILDIGGQDMKCLRVKDGVIDHIMLNEACSSGCGSFIESFAAGHEPGRGASSRRRRHRGRTSAWTWAAAAPCS